MTFFTEPLNLILIAAAAISGALLVWPMLTRRAQGLSIAQATQLINRRNALVIDVPADLPSPIASSFKIGF